MQQAFLNGQWLPHAEAAVPVSDAGFVQGATVAEQIRTFRGELFRLPEHLQRLARSLEIVGVDCGYTLAELHDIAVELVRRNYALERPEQDLGLSIFVTPGLYPAQTDGDAASPLVGLHTYRLAFHLWASKYEQGERLISTPIVQVPGDCWPAELKCRSRMHYYLADRWAQRRQPGSRAVICDQQGRVLETSTANLVLYRRDEGLVSPPSDVILPGISLGELRELAHELEIPWTERPIELPELEQADEALLCSTSVCVLPAVEVNGRPLGDGRPGPIYRQLLQCWSDRVGLDIAGQARQRASRREK